MADAKKPARAIEPWQVLESKYSYRDRWLAVRSDTVRVPGLQADAAGSAGSHSVSTGTFESAGGL